MRNLNNEKVNNLRNANIELLRIISMLMVLMMHCLQSSGALECGGSYQVVYRLIKSFCIVAVNIFVIINGYFGPVSNFKLKNVFKIWGIVWFYSITTYVFAICMGMQIMSTSSLIGAVCPLLTKKYWFVNSYLGLYIISPFLDKFLKRLTKHQTRTLLCILIFLFSVRSTVFPSTWCLDSSGGYGIIWFTVLYLIAGAIKLHYSASVSSGCYMEIYLGNVLIVFIGNYVLERTVGTLYAQKFYGYNSIFVMIAAVALFMYMLKLEPMNKPICYFVNIIAKSAFSVYIIHYSVNDILWTQLLGLQEITLNSIKGIIQVVIAVIVVYFICTMIDFVRRTVIYRLIELQVVSRYILKINKTIEKAQNKIYDFE